MKIPIPMPRHHRESRSDDARKQICHRVRGPEIINSTPPHGARAKGNVYQESIAQLNAHAEAKTVMPTSPASRTFSIPLKSLGPSAMSVKSDFKLNTGAVIPSVGLGESTRPASDMILGRAFAENAGDTVCRNMASCSRRSQGGRQACLEGWV